MITVESSVRVDGLASAEVTDFLLHPADDRYQAWWPGTHLQFHLVADSAGQVGGWCGWTSTSALAGFSCSSRRRGRAGTENHVTAQAMGAAFCLVAARAC
jgi:hypothetical protein